MKYNALPLSGTVDYCNSLGKRSMHAADSCEKRAYADRSRSPNDFSVALVHALS